jgi:hypothetical protein
LAEEVLGLEEQAQELEEDTTAKDEGEDSYEYSC